jgi:hypothetical protein
MDDVLIIEDVGTTGSQSVVVIKELQGMGVTNIHEVNTWRRNPTLPRLDELGIRYDSMIAEVLPTYTKSDCENLPDGFCNQGVLLIPRGQ